MINYIPQAPLNLEELEKDPIKLVSVMVKSKREEFFSTLISDWERSPVYNFIQVCDRYYKSHNDIENAKRMVYGRSSADFPDPVLVESKVLANNKIQHNFFRKLVRQKLGYMLGKPFTLTTVNEPTDESKECFKEVYKRLDKRFQRVLKSVARDAIAYTIGWMRVYYDTEGNLRFKHLNPSRSVPIWKDEDHTELEGFLYYYDVTEYLENGIKNTVKYVEWYDSTGIYYYTTDPATGKLVPDKRDPHPSGFSAHFNIKESSSGMLWSHIPIIAFKYDSEEAGLLSRIKSLIDEYDKRVSSVANTVDDIPNSVKVIKDYDGENREEFVANMNQFRTIFVQGTGDAKGLDTEQDFTGIEAHLERLRQDLYELGSGVNTSNKDIRDTSGVALRFLYADLDMDCQDWASEMDWSLEQVIWFVLADIAAKTGKNYTNIEYNVVYNTDVILNETETINNCAVSNGLISQETIAANHPWVKDADAEISALDAEKQKMLKEEAALNTGFGSRDTE